MQRTLCGNTGQKIAPAQGKKPLVQWPTNFSSDTETCKFPNQSLSPTDGTGITQPTWLHGQQGNINVTIKTQEKNACRTQKEPTILTKNTNKYQKALASHRICMVGVQKEHERSP